MAVQNYTTNTTPSAVRLTREGVQLGDRVVPLLSGSAHYWRLDPDDWQACLTSIRDMGCTFVDVYVPWSVHEQPDGSMDFGSARPELAVGKFLKIARELGLFAIVRPGPHINAELSGFGLPESVLWDDACQARSPAGERVILPMPPQAFPVPSYASRALLTRACAWLHEVATELGALAWPNGPIALLQIDNEGALYFRDGVYEQDYHPDSIADYRAGLEHKYATPNRLAEAYGVVTDNFEIAPPERFDAQSPRELCRHLDWAEHQERLIADAFAKFRKALSHSGFERLPTCHNLPMGEAATPLDPSRLGKVVECLGMDYYHVAAEPSADAILRRSSEVVTRAEAFDYPAFAVELAAGFPPFFPPLTEQDNRFAALSCLAAGLRGFNLYMAVERDRWIGAPIDRFGARRPTFDFWARLNAAITRLNLNHLTRAADICIVVPRSLHRLERLLHAFGPLSAAAFDIMGLSAYDSCAEEGPFASALFEAERFLRTLLRELTERGLAYHVTGNDSASWALSSSKLAVAICGHGLEPELWETLREAARRKPLLVGPQLPTTTPDGTLALPAPLKTDGGDLVVVSEPELAAALLPMAERERAFRLEAGPGIRTSLFRDSGGAPHVLFVTNTIAEPRVARMSAPYLVAAVDALDGDVFRAKFGALEVPLSPHSVRMLELR